MRIPYIFSYLINLSFDKLEWLLLTRFDHMFIHCPGIRIRYRNDLAEEIVKGTTYNRPGCNRRQIKCRQRFLLAYTARRTIYLVARDRSIEILYRGGVRVTFLDECSWLPSDIHTRRQIATIIPYVWPSHGTSSCVGPLRRYIILQGPFRSIIVGCYS